MLMLRVHIFISTFPSTGPRGQTVVTVTILGNLDENNQQLAMSEQHGKGKMTSARVTWLALAIDQRRHQEPLSRPKRLLQTFLSAYSRLLHATWHTPHPQPCLLVSFRLSWEFSPLFSLRTRYLWHTELWLRLNAHFSLAQQQAQK